VVIFIRMRAQGRGSGIEVDRPDALVYEIRDGIIRRIDYYNDRSEALKALGLRSRRSQMFHERRNPCTSRGVALWARLDSNQGPTDYESAALTN
jgi:hypothetical protein